MSQLLSHHTDPCSTAGVQNNAPSPTHFKFVVVPPDTAGNFMDFNVPCEDLNSDFLMQPVNEADYDSETQACVDANTGGPSNFYDHYVTKRRKKRNKRGPQERTVQELNTKYADLQGGETVAGIQEVDTNNHLGVVGSRTGSTSMKKSSDARPAATAGGDTLTVPGALGVPRNALSTPAARRMACGGMPPSAMAPALPHTAVSWKTEDPSATANAVNAPAAAAGSSSPNFKFVVVPPDTAGNFMDFNVPCEDLNSDFLMQPVNEADYDSETQACVDANTGGPSNFYDHYVTKRRKKRGKRGPQERTVQELNTKYADLQPPEPGVPQTADVDDGDASGGGTSSSSSSSSWDAEERESRSASATGLVIPSGAAVPKKRKKRVATTRKQSSPQQQPPPQTKSTAPPEITLQVHAAATAGVGGGGGPPVDGDSLLVPGAIGVPKGALSSVAVRRLATGAMPPMDRPVLPQPTSWSSAPPAPAPAAAVGGSSGKFTAKRQSSGAGKFAGGDGGGGAPPAPPTMSTLQVVPPPPAYSQGSACGSDSGEPPLMDLTVDAPQ